MDETQGRLLVKLARLSIDSCFDRKKAAAELDQLLPGLDGEAFAQRRGVFVTLKKAGQLRGCIGSLTATASIRDGVAGNAVNAAFRDPRFPPVTADELAAISIEVSILTAPKPLAYSDPDDLVRRLRPGIDGVILEKGGARATFLPQVWEQLPEPAVFLGHLCLKAGLKADCWQRDRPGISLYQVEKFSEPG